MLPAFPRRVGRRALLLIGALVVLFSAVPLPHFDWLPDTVVDRAIPTLREASAEEVADIGAVADEAVPADRVNGAESNLTPFTTIGLSLDHDPTGPVFVRTSEHGAWGAWQELDFAPAEGPDPGSAEAAGADAKVDGATSEPIWVREADGYEISVGADSAAGAEVVLVRDVQRFAMTQATPMADAEVPPQFGIHSRAEWGARGPVSTGYGDTVKLAVVHHSVTPNDYSPADVPAALRSIQSYHMDSRGWSDIAYNFVVDKYGGIWEGRGGGIDRPVIGAHAAGFNTNTVGVMVLGDYSATGASGAALESVSQVIGWKLFLHHADPAGSVAFTSGGSPSIPAGQVVNLPRVVGHQDVGSTGCPGSIEGNLGFIRARSQDWTNWLRATSVPFGALDVVASGAGTVAASGWAIDPDVATPARVLVVAGGAATEFLASGPRPDVGAAHPAYGSNRGFSGVLSGVPPGYQEACVTIVNQGYGLGNVGLGCRTVFVPDPTGKSPTGTVNSAGGFSGGFLIGGTALDPESPGSPIFVDVEVDGAVVARLSTQAGSGAFWGQVLGVLGGNRRVCLVGRNIYQGQDMRFDCRDIGVGAAKPVGVWDTAVVNGPAGAIGVWGWAYDGETLGAVQVEVTVDDRRYYLTADQGRSDLAAALPGYGPTHGFSGTVYPGKGNFRVCINLLDVGGSNHTGIGCRQLLVK